jgi:hypothetical protein
MTELEVPYPPTTMPPAAEPGMVIHSVYDTSAYMGTAEQKRYLAAYGEEERLEALRRMPDATVTFYQLPEGEPFFDID